MRRIITAAFAIGLLSGLPAVAKTVETETIPITPQATPLIESPVDDIAPVGEDEGLGHIAGPDDIVEMPQVLYNTDMLPKAAARMHSQLREAALSGNMERLRMVLESNEMPPTLSFTKIDDPIDFLKKSSGDGEGFEILAIIADILDAGFLHVDEGTPQEMYIWPYFSRYPLFNLTPDQKVELFRIVTAGDFAEMQDFGAWTFYRIGIGPDGTLHYFVAGD
ncbi:hypothetical protein FMN50_16330 [Rhodobacterales bacterium]|nr:hypothetical protein FMN50_16330 [Rhodobacterales bacterium]